MSGLRTLVLVGVGQQRQETGTLDGGGELALVAGAGASDARRHDLGDFGDEVFQQLDVFVVDLLDAFGREAAVFAAAGESASAPFGSSHVRFLPCVVIR